MFKMFSCLILITCSCMLGYMKASSYKCRCLELENIIESINLLKMEMIYKREPLAKSFQKIADMRSGWFSDLLKSCSSMMGNCSNLIDSWELSVKEYIHKSPLKEKDLTILEDLIMGLGRSDSEGQRNLFEPALARLKNNLNEANIQEQKLGKMYIALGTAAGVMAVVLLI